MPFAGLRYLWRRPRLALYALPPALLLGALMFVVYALVTRWADPLMESVWSRPAGQGAFVRWFLGPMWAVAHALLYISLLIGGSGVAWVAASPIAGPFNELLSEKVEALETGFEAPFSLPIMLRNLATSLAHVLAFGLLQALVWAAALLIGLIPIVGQVIAALMTSFTAPLLAGFVPLDFPTTLRLWSFREKLNFMVRHFAVFWGFSVSSFFLLYLPLVNIIFLPACVTGATLLVLDLERRKLLAAPDRRKALLLRAAKAPPPA
jgi:CysZ protein